MPHPNKRVTKAPADNLPALDPKAHLEAITESLLVECSDIIKKIDIATLKMAYSVLQRLEMIKEDTERQIVLQRYKPLLDLAEKKEARIASALGISASQTPGVLIQQYFGAGSSQVINPDVARAIGGATRPVALITEEEDLSDG